MQKKFLSLENYSEEKEKHQNVVKIISTRARGYTTVFMLNSAEHEILNAHKYKNIKKFSIV